MDKKFLYAKNTYNEPHPGPGAIVFTAKPGPTTVAVALTIEGDDWYTELTFVTGEGSMWIYPPEPETDGR